MASGTQAPVIVAGSLILILSFDLCCNPEQNKAPLQSQLIAQAMSLLGACIVSQSEEIKLR